MDKTLANWVVKQQKICPINQHDVEWYTIRKFTIGGSSMATIMDLNRYSNITALIHERLTARKVLTPLEKINMNWGTLFEEVAKQYSEYNYKTTIVGENLFLNNKEYEPFSYSPDGFAAINNKISLFEFKCPMSRLPGRLVPANYLPQIKLGLALLDCTDNGIFGEFVIRRCSLQDLTFKNKNIELLPRQKTLVRHKPIAMGIIGFKTKTQMDMALVDEYTFATELDLALQNPANIVYYPICHTESEVEAIKATVKETKFLCWKLVDVKFHNVFKETDYLDDVRETAQLVVDCVKNCIENMDKKNVIINHTLHMIEQLNCPEWSDE